MASITMDGKTFYTGEKGYRLTLAKIRDRIIGKKILFFPEDNTQDIATVAKEQPIPSIAKNLKVPTPSIAKNLKVPTPFIAKNLKVDKRGRHKVFRLTSESGEVVFFSNVTIVEKKGVVAIISQIHRLMYYKGWYKEYLKVKTMEYLANPTNPITATRFGRILTSTSDFYFGPIKEYTGKSRVELILEVAKTIDNYEWFEDAMLSWVFESKRSIIASHLIQAIRSGDYTYDKEFRRFLRKAGIKADETTSVENIRYRAELIVETNKQKRLAEIGKYWQMIMSDEV